MERGGRREIEAQAKLNPSTRRPTTQTARLLNQKVRTVTVETKAVPLSALRVPPQQVQEISSVEASLRLDAIASAGEATRRG